MRRDTATGARTVSSGKRPIVRAFSHTLATTRADTAPQTKDTAPRAFVPMKQGARRSRFSVAISVRLYCGSFGFTRRGRESLGVGCFFSGAGGAPVMRGVAFAGFGLTALSAGLTFVLGATLVFVSVGK